MNVDHLQRVNGEDRSFGSFAFVSAFGGLEGIDTENGRFSSDGEGEHNVENFMLCSFAHHACSPLLQGCLHQEELCKAALTCHFSLDVISLCQD